MSQTKAQLINAVDGSIVDADIVGLTSSKLSGALPALSAANLTNIPAANLTGTLPAISGANLTGISAGITMADMWRLSTSFNGVSSSQYITANWERVDTDGFGQIGTGMTESSGEFTFPSTGIYLIDFRARGSKGNGEVQYAGVKIYVTLDNSGYSEAANSYSGSGGTGYYYAIGCQHIFDVTSTSTHKVKFQFEASHPADIHGNSDYTSTGVSFIRLGDT
jgi:hypothetical protein